MFKLSFDVVYTNGDRSTVTTRPSADIAFERRFGRTVASLFASAPMTGDDLDLADALRWFAENISTEQNAFLAYAAARSELEFDDWLDGVDEIQWRFGEPTTVDPTQPTPSAS